VSYTIKNLREVEDLAAKHGFSELQEARFPRHDLDAEATGVAYILLRAGKRQPFAHRHNEAEEIYVVLAGSGRVKLDDEVVDIRALDSIRLSPGVARAFEAGAEDLEILVFGPHHDKDAEIIEGDFWASSGGD
jgi:mannose-6-phosphate isomerase-like protein (cupin superfamily)